MAMTAQTEGTRKSAAQPASVKITAAKGRPMLSWVGKRPLREVRAYPAQLVERFSADGSVSDAVDWTGWPDRYDRGGLLFHGDNKEVLAHQLANGFRGKVDLVYIDPPFDSGADYVRRVQLRGASGLARLDGESYTLGEQIQYTDIWGNDTDWRSMVDSVMIDTDYGGEAFNVVAADIPERKSDLVAGSYELELPEGAAPVAVKITDMLGEDVLVVLDR